MADEDMLKICIIGHPGIGKTCLTVKFVDGNFAEEVSDDFDSKLKDVDVLGKSVKLVIWDTRGQEKLTRVTCGWYRGATGIFVVYDVTDQDSFDNVDNWLKDVNRYLDDASVVRYLVATKIDLESERVISTEQGKALAEKLNLPFIETSSKTGKGVDDMFMSMATKIMETRVGSSKGKKDEGKSSKEGCGCVIA